MTLVCLWRHIASDVDFTFLRKVVSKSESLFQASCLDFFACVMKQMFRNITRTHTHSYKHTRSSAAGVRAIGR